MLISYFARVSDRRCRWCERSKQSPLAPSQFLASATTITPGFDDNNTSRSIFSSLASSLVVLCVTTVSSLTHIDFIGHGTSARQVPRPKTATSRTGSALDHFTVPVENVDIITGLSPPLLEIDLAVAIHMLGQDLVKSWDTRIWASTQRNSQQTSQ